MSIAGSERSLKSDSVSRRTVLAGGAAAPLFPTGTRPIRIALKDPEPVELAVIRELYGTAAVRSIDNAEGIKARFVAMNQSLKTRVENGPG